MVGRKIKVQFCIKSNCISFSYILTTSVKVHVTWSDLTSPKKTESGEVASQRLSSKKSEKFLLFFDVCLLVLHFYKDLNSGKSRKSKKWQIPRNIVDELSTGSADHRERNRSAEDFSGLPARVGKQFVELFERE